MATEPIATILSRRCSSCGVLYPHDGEHVCPGSANAESAAVQIPESAAAPTVETLVAKTVETARPANLEASGPPPPETTATQPMPSPAAPPADTTQLPSAGRAEQPTVDSPRAASTTAPSPAKPAATVTVKSGAVVQVDLVGLVLGERYEIKERLSAGGMGVVYKGRHIVLESPVAVKVLLKPQDSTAQRRFLQEAKVASAIRHPNTVYISDFGVLPDGRSYLVMEFLQGPTLAKVLGSGRIEPVRACRIALQIAQGLQAVHARGIVHRDLKPDNIFLIDHVKEQAQADAQGSVGQPGQKDFVKIVDFGIAVAARGTRPIASKPQPEQGPAAQEKTSEPAAAEAAAPKAPSAEPATDGQPMLNLSERHTQAGVVLGTPHYMSPEQADDRDVDQRADQYALGCILFEMLTGKVPFDHPTSGTNILMQHMSAPVPSPRKVCPAAKIPESLDALVLRMMAKEREQRYPSLTEVAALLSAELSVMEPEESTIHPAGGAGGRFAGRMSITTKVVLRPQRWQLWAATFGVIGLVASVGYLGVQRWQQGRATAKAVSTQLVQELRGQALTVLQQLLHAPAASLRQQAAEGLGRARDVSQRAALQPLLADPDPAVQAQAADALGQLGDREAVAALKELLGRSSEPNVRAAAAAALDVLGDEEGPRQLRQMLDGRDEQGRFRAAYLLCEKGDRKATAVLSEILQRQSPPDDVAVDIMARLAQAGEESARRALLVRLDAAEKLQRRLLIARRLTQIGEPRGRQVLEELASRPGPDQLLAARLLASPEATAQTPLFRRVLSERAATEPEQQLAIEGLGLTGQLVDLLLLRARLAPTMGERLRLVTATAVLQLAAAAPGVMSEQSLAWAQGALRDGNWLVRQSAVAVLGDAPSDRATQLILPLLKDGDARVRRGAVKALWRRPASREVLASLRVMLFDTDGGVREETLQALLRVGRALQKQGEKGLPTELSGWLKELLASGAAREQLLARTVLYKLGDESQSTALHSFQTSADRELRRLYVHEQEGDPAALSQALTDEDPAVRLIAARRLAESGDGRGVSILRDALSQGGANGLLAYGLLRKLGQAAELPKDASELLSSPKVEDRMESVEALGKLPPEVAVPLLFAAAQDPERLVRRLVAEIAADLPALPTPEGGPAVPAGVPILRRLQQDLDAGVRFRATVLLLRFGTLPPPTSGLVKTEPRRDKPRPPPEPPADAAPDAGAPPVPDAGAADAAPPAPAVPAIDSNAAPPAGESAVEKLAHAGLLAFARKDYTTALKQMDKAARECAKKRKSELACALISTELPLRIGQIYEGRGDFSEAMAEYEKAQRAGRRLKGHADLVAAVEKASGQLGHRLGAVVRPKGSGADCKEVTTWLEPGGPYTFTVDGRSQVVNLRAGETIKLGECH